MTVLLTNPNPFAERILLFGGGGSGKTNSVCSIGSHTTGHMYVSEIDLSAPYQRAIQLDFPEMEDKTTIIQPNDWPEFLEGFTEHVATADPDEDWIVVDSASPVTYHWVQDWTLEQCYGNDLPKMLMELRREHQDTTSTEGRKEFFAAKSDLMQWDIVKKEYNRFWREVRRWKGNLILTAEAKEVGKYLNKDEESKRLYGPIMFFPDGQNTLRHAMSTTLFLDHAARNQWTYTTVKDRNREEQDKEEVTDFAMDYLMGVAGWQRARKNS